MSQKSTIVTHNGRFHSDDVFAVATLRMVLSEDGSEVVVVRTRDEDFINNANYVVDVGGVYDSAVGRFDHHQAGGAGVRENGVPYAAFGLVWKEYGEKLSGSISRANAIDTRLVAPLDAADNGVATYTPLIDGVYQYDMDMLVGAYVPTWKEDPASLDEIFLSLVDMAESILRREIVRTTDIEEANKKVLASYESSEDKRFIVLDGYYPWREVLLEKKEPLYVAYPHPTDNSWHIYAVAESLHSFNQRKPFPEEWAGLMGEDLARVSGVSDAKFCHNKRFLVVTSSMDGAIKIGQKALVS